MIVRKSRCEDRQSYLYDFDEYSHVIIISDWLHTLADDKYPNYFRTIELETYNPSSYLINGMGSWNVNDEINIYFHIFKFRNHWY